MPVFGCLLVLFFMMQFGLAGRWITFPKGREHAQGVCSKFGQPKAKCNLTVLAMKCIPQGKLYWSCCAKLQQKRRIAIYQVP